jgi:endonuclease YncB( thermonuclease family)
VVTVTNVIDGDTIDTTAGRVRLIGIDTPERGECNYGPAADELLRLISEQSDQVVLVRGGTDDTDRYDRLLRYVDTIGGRDLNLHMITAGYATARYDSRDGYPRHHREEVYRAAAQSSPAQPPC